MPLSETSQRKIIHVDLDAFFAAVEILDNPALKDMPVIVGGNPDGRGVVSSACYRARKAGVRSAMPSATARKKCPDAVFLKPRFQRYKEVSQQFFAILKNFAPEVEPVSIDEAYLDVTDCATLQPATEIAAAIRAEIASSLSLTASAGVAPNKMLAKIASDLNKPDGLTVIRPQMVESFLKAMPVAKIPGVGKKTNEKLAKLGIRVCSDVWKQEETIARNWGNFGKWLIERSHGLDERRLQVSWTRKSVGCERTFFEDILLSADLDGHLDGLLNELERRMEKTKVRGRTICLKVKFSNFSQITRQVNMVGYTNDKSEISSHVKNLLAAVKSKSGAGEKIRLLGLSMRDLQANALPYQPLLFASDPEDGSKP